MGFPFKVRTPGSCSGFLNSRQKLQLKCQVTFVTRSIIRCRLRFWGWGLELTLFRLISRTPVPWQSTPHHRTAVGHRQRALSCRKTPLQPAGQWVAWIRIRIQKQVRNQFLVRARIQIHWRPLRLDPAPCCLNH